MQNYLGALSKGRGGGVTSHMKAIIRKCAAQMGGFYTQKKSVNMGLISTPQKIPKRGLNL